MAISGNMQIDYAHRDTQTQKHTQTLIFTGKGFVSLSLYVDKTCLCWHLLSAFACAAAQGATSGIQPLAQFINNNIPKVNIVL